MPKGCLQEESPTRTPEFFRGILRFLGPAPEVEPLSDKATIDRNYRYWRTRILYTTIIGYALFYVVRKSLAMAMPGIEQELGISKSDLGLFLTLHGVMYGVSKFLNGYFGDQANPRYFMAIGLILSALMTFFFGLSGGVLSFGLFWLFNGYFQGMGFPPCARSMTHWFSPKERAAWIGVWNTSHSIGTAITLILGGYLAMLNWRLCFFVAAGIGVLGALFILNRLRDTPPSVGLPPVEQFKGEVGVEEEKEIRDKSEKRSFNRFLIEHVFMNPLIWYLSIANFFVYMVRYAILDWGPTFLLQEKGIELHLAGWMVAFYEISGIAGMLISGYITNTVFKSHAGRTCFFYMLFCTLFVLMLWKLPISSNLGYFGILCGAGFFIYGPQCLVGVIAANLATKRAAATAIGLTGFFGYLSTILSGYGVGYIVVHYCWDTAISVFFGCALVACVLFLILWNVSAKTEIAASKA